MRVRITQGYTDSHLGRIVHRDEEFSVSEARAKRLIETGVAEAVSEDISDYTDKIAALETENAALKKAIEESTGYNGLADEDLAILAAGKNINIDGMTRNKVIKALEKAV